MTNWCVLAGVVIWPYLFTATKLSQYLIPTWFPGFLCIFPQSVVVWYVNFIKFCTISTRNSEIQLSSSKGTCQMDSKYCFECLECSVASWEGFSVGPVMVQWWTSNGKLYKTSHGTNWPMRDAVTFQPIKMLLFGRVCFNWASDGPIMANRYKVHHRMTTIGPVMVQ